MKFTFQYYCRRILGSVWNPESTNERKENIEEKSKKMKIRFKT